jgi:hypothetical protein
MDKVTVDLAAFAGVAFKERYNMPVVAEVAEREQPGTFTLTWRKTHRATDWHPLFHVYLTSPKLNKTYTTLRFLT